LIQEKTTSPLRAKRRYSVAAIFAFLSLIVIFSWRYYSSFQWNVFFETLSELSSSWLALGAALALLSYVGRAARWKVMMLPAHSSLPRLISATMIGFSGVVLLGRAGEVVRPVLIARHEQSTVPAQVAIWLLERLYDLLLILLLFGLGLAEAEALNLSPGSRLTPIFRAGGGVVVVAAGCAAGLLYILGRHPATCHSQVLRLLSFLPDPILARVSKTMDSFLHGARSLGRPKVAAASLLLTILEWAIIVAAIWCFFQAYPQSRGLSFLDVAVYLGFVSLGNIVQLPGIGGGVQIASIVVLRELFHMPLEVATGLSLLVWAGSALIVLPIGIPLAIAGHVKLSELRRAGSGENDSGSKEPVVAGDGSPWQ
jgi:uncharacterized membrane protein YbhN (UPF0104 family)